MLLISAYIELVAVGIDSTVAAGSYAAGSVLNESPVDFQTRPCLSPQARLATAKERWINGGVEFSHAASFTIVFG